MRCAYPLLLDLTDRSVVIIGGGAVAARKAAGVIAAGAARVTIVAPALTATIPEGVEHLAQKYDPVHLTAADLVFAATDHPEINAQVVRDARAAGILANRADTDEVDPGDFTVPAMLRRGSLTIAVSASGSPLLAARIRDVIADSLAPKWSTLADAAQEIRPIILRSVNDPDHRRRALLDLASDDAADQLEKGGNDALLCWLAQRHPQFKR